MLGGLSLPTEGEESGVVHQEQWQPGSTAWQTPELAARSHPQGHGAARPVENVTQMFL